MAKVTKITYRKPSIRRIKAKNGHGSKTAVVKGGVVRAKRKTRG